MCIRDSYRPSKKKFAGPSRTGFRSAARKVMFRGREPARRSANTKRQIYGNRKNLFANKFKERIRRSFYALYRDYFEEEDDFEREFEDANWCYHIEEGDIVSDDENGEDEFEEALPMVCFGGSTDAPELKNYADCYFIPNRKSDLLFVNVTIPVAGGDKVKFRALIDTEKG